MTHLHPDPKGHLMTLLRQYLRLVQCTVRALAAVYSSNWEALFNTVRDVEEVHRLLGHDFDPDVVRSREPTWRPDCAPLPPIPLDVAAAGVMARVALVLAETAHL